MSLALVNEQIWWFIARSSGIVAWFLLTASVLWGIFLATDLFPKHRRPAWLLDLHRWLGGLTVCFVAFHIAALIADSYIEFSLADVLVPMHADWKPLPVAVGVIAMWVLVAVQLTSLARRHLPRSVWRGVHLASYVAFWLTSLHSTFAGTDRTQPIYLASSIASIVAVMMAALYRVLSRRGARMRLQSPIRQTAESTPAPVPSGHDPGPMIAARQMEVLADATSRR